MNNSNRLVVLTGFEPFGDFEVNPSWEVARTFDGIEIDSFKVKSFQIPLAYKEIKPTVTQVIDDHKPAVMINLGQSYRPLISLEKVAINFADLTGEPTSCGWVNLRTIGVFSSLFWGILYSLQENKEEG